MVLSKKTTSLFVSIILSSIPLLSIFGVSGVFVLLAASLILFISKHDSNMSFQRIDQAFAIILSLPFLVAIISMLANHSWDWSYIDKYIRYPLGALAFILMLKGRKTTLNLSIIKLGFYATAFVGFFFALYQKMVLGVQLAYAGIFSISFGEIMTAVAIISLLKFDSGKINKLPWRLSAFTLAMLASVMAGTKGAWIVYPFLMWVISDFHYNKNTVKQFTAFVASILVIAVLLCNIPFSKHRIEEAVNEVAGYYNHNDFKPTSQGLRLMMWNTALQIYAENPCFGVGPSNVSDELIKHCRNSPNESIRSGLESYQHYMVHAHNDWLESLAGQGIGGILALVLFAFFPAAICFKNRRKYSGTIRMWIYFNILINVGFVGFCTTQCLHMAPRDFWIAFSVISFAQIRILQSKESVF